MAPFLAIILSFPSVVFTVLLGVVLVYWLFVVVGVVHVGHDGAAEGLADGASDGLADGASDGLADGGLEGAAKGAAEGAADGVDGHDGGFAELFAALKLRSAPATVVLSLIVIFSWLLTVLAMTALHRTGLAHSALFGILMLLVAPVLSLPITSLLVRPLARFFVPTTARGQRDFIGKVCTVRTGTVDDAFGEATIEGGGADVVLRVRVDDGALKRGDQAVIVSWDESKEAFIVASLDDALADDGADDATAPRERKARR